MSEPSNPSEKVQDVHPPSKSTKKPSKKVLIVAFMTIFLDLLGFGIIIPIQPFYAKSLGATATVVTLLGASYSVMQFFFSPFWGGLSDKIGRRPIILFSIVISAIGHFMFAMASGLTTLFLARMLAGFGNANIGTAQAIIADVTTAENRSTGMALIGVAFGLGFLFGPAMGGYLGGISPSMPFWVAGGLSVVNWFFALFFLKETKTADSTHKARPIFDLEVFKRSKQYLNVSAVLWITLIYTTAFALMEQAIALYIEHVWITDTTLSMDARIEAAGWKTANYLVLVGVTAIVVQGGLVRPLTKKFGEVWMARVGIGLVVVAIAGIPLSGSTGNFGLFCVTAIIMAFGTGLLNPAKSALISRGAPDDEQGAVLGLNQSFSAMGRVLGPVFSGMLFEWFVGAPFFSAAGLLLIASVVAMKLQPPETPMDPSAVR
jgi:MFS transporter, DHA1 family, tetracycline resistance protein